MGKKAKLKGLRNIAGSLKPFLIRDELPIYFPGKMIQQEGKLRIALTPTWGKELIDALNPHTEYVVGHNVSHRLKNHYEIMKQLIKGCDEKEAMVRLDDYVALHKH